MVVELLRTYIEWDLNRESPALLKAYMSALGSYDSSTLTDLPRTVDNLRAVAALYSLGVISINPGLYRYFSEFSDADLCLVFQDWEFGRSASVFIDIVVERHRSQMDWAVKEALSRGMDRDIAEANVVEAVYRAMRVYDAAKAQFKTCLAHWLNRNTHHRAMTQRSIANEFRGREDGVNVFSMDAVDFDLPDNENDRQPPESDSPDIRGLAYRLPVELRGYILGVLAGRTDEELQKAYPDESIEDVKRRAYARMKELHNYDQSQGLLFS